MNYEEDLKKDEETLRQASVTSLDHHVKPVQRLISLALLSDQADDVVHLTAMRRPSNVAASNRPMESAAAPVLFHHHRLMLLKL